MVKFTSLHKYISINCIHKEVKIAIDKGHNLLDIIEIQYKKLEHLKYRHLKWYCPKAVKIFHYKIHLAGCITCPIVSTFLAQKARFEKSQCPKPVWLRPKRNFLEKVAFWVCEENAHDGKGAQRSILSKVHARYHIYIGRSWAITKLPFTFY